MPKCPNIDFETYSSAGFLWEATRGRWVSSVSSGKAGLPGVGAPVYSEHESTEVVCMAYDMHKGDGVKLWTPGLPAPQELLAHVAQGGLVRAANTRFEYLIWNNACTRLYSWPVITIEQMRDPLANARAYGLPGSLEKVAEALHTDAQKDKEGKRLIRKFSIPRTPTKTDSSLRKLAEEDPLDGSLFYEYCRQDVRTEDAIYDRVPELPEDELELWLLDQRINDRGVAIDLEGLAVCCDLVDRELAKGNAIVTDITGGAVTSVSQVARIVAWLKDEKGVRVGALDKEGVASALEHVTMDGEARSVLQLRQMLGAASVKKVYSMRGMVSGDGRLRDLFMYYGASTGRWAGRGPQPQNLPNSGPRKDWGVDDVDTFLANPSTEPNAIPAVAGSLRGLFVAAEGHDLICSDYSAIEAVVLAALAGEQWRLHVFHTHGKIYEMSASKITGTPFEEFAAHKERTGDHHPLRKKIGKVAELASGYQGGIGAWKAFGADKHLTDDEIKDAIKKWRAESPMIKAYWFEVEACALRAVRAPGSVHGYRGTLFQVKDNVLGIRLVSGRTIYYQEPRIIQKTMPWGDVRDAVAFMGVDSYTKKWVLQDTYGGKLTENIVQATARDLLKHAMLSLEAAGYPIVMHVHDEIIAEIPRGFGSIEEFERIMASTPTWAAGWPVRAAGGWRGRRYRKD